MKHSLRLDIRITRSRFRDDKSLEVDRHYLVCDLYRVMNEEFLTGSMD